MQLEIISRYPATPTCSTPLLFVHGSFTRAQVWDKHFLPYFAEQGYAAHAVSLRGHGASGGHAGALWWSLADYVTDLGQAVATLPQPPVLIGHSLGGMVAQKYLETARVPGVVLMASTPPHGLLASIWSMAVDNPLLLQCIGLVQAFGPWFATLEVIRQALFSDDAPDARLRPYIRLLERASYRVCLDMLGLNPLRLPRDHGVPMLVMGAGRDAFFSPGLVRETARHYGAEAVILPELAHAMMLETNWRQAAACLSAWLDARFKN